MKIGIITYHCSNNYGAQLQAYATCHFLQKMGHEAEVIDCNTIGVGPIFMWSLESPRAIFGSIRNNFLSLVSERKRYRLFNEFSRNMIGLSKPCYTKVELDKACKNYDYIITGSDQVWHPMICEGNTRFFLDLPIPDNRKIAYAPSFGVSEYSKEEVDEYMPLISKIGHLSVREESGRRMIKKYTGRDAKIVVDPTMLLTRADWDKILIPAKYQKYLFYFTILDEPNGTDELVRKIAQEKGLEIVRIGTVRDIMKRGFINARANGPQQFLGLVRDADFVVTTSFHGTVFSILYEKQFLCVLNNNDRNSRMETLLSGLGLDSRMIRNIHNSKISKVSIINYQDVNARLAELREESMQFLNNSIKE